MFENKTKREKMEIKEILRKSLSKISFRNGIHSLFKWERWHHIPYV